VTRIRVVRSVEELEQVRAPWERLQSTHYATDPDVFPLILSWRRAVRPHVLELQRDREPRALVLGRIEDIHLRTKLGYRTVYSPQLRSLTIVYRGILGELLEEDAQLILLELRRALADGEADVLRLRNLEVGSPLHRAASAQSPRLLRETSSPPTAHWQLHVPSSYDDFLHSLSRSSRESAKRYSKRLEKQFGDRLSVGVYRDLADADRVFADLRAVAVKTYQQGLGVAFAQSVIDRKIAIMLMENGWFRAHVLYLDGNPIAFWHGHDYHGVFTTGVPGFDPTYTDLRVGNYVLFKLIEALCADETIDTLDYGFGDAEYKRRFGSRSWVEQDIHLFAPTVKGIRTNALRSSTLGLGNLAQRALSQTGALDRLKRNWRDRLSRQSGGS
jgi:CelD/BcsL family acetyltransferase involved in cellulose biosynthesis